jgi:hypothetical protein
MRKYANHDKHTHNLQCNGEAAKVVTPKTWRGGRAPDDDRGNTVHTLAAGDVNDHLRSLFRFTPPTFAD